MKTVRRRFPTRTRLKAFNLELISMVDARRRAHRGGICAEYSHGRQARREGRKRRRIAPTVSKASNTEIANMITHQRVPRG